jgi:hypothetical protein
MPQYKKPAHIVFVKKNDYMRRRLEIENASLKVKVHQLEKTIAQMNANFLDEIKEFERIIENQ